MITRETACVQFTVFGETIESLHHKADIYGALEGHSLEFVMYQFDGSPPEITNFPASSSKSQLMSPALDSATRNLESLYNELKENGKFEGDEMKQLSAVFNWIHAKTAQCSDGIERKVEPYSHGPPNMSPIYGWHDAHEALDDELNISRSEIASPNASSLQKATGGTSDSPCTVDGFSRSSLYPEAASMCYDAFFQPLSLRKVQPDLRCNLSRSAVAESFTCSGMIMSNGFSPANESGEASSAAPRYMESLCFQPWNMSFSGDSQESEPHGCSTSIDEPSPSIAFNYNHDLEQVFAIASVVEMLLDAAVAESSAHLRDGQNSTIGDMPNDKVRSSTSFDNEDEHSDDGMKDQGDDAGCLSTGISGKREDASDYYSGMPSTSENISALLDDCDSSFASLEDYVGRLEEMNDNDMKNKGKPNRKKRRDCFTKRKKSIRCRFPGCNSIVVLRSYTIKRHALIHREFRSSCALCDFRSKSVKSVAFHLRKQHSAIPFTTDHMRSYNSQHNLRGLVHKCFPIEKVSDCAVIRYI